MGFLSGGLKSQLTPMQAGLIFGGAVAAGVIALVVLRPASTQQVDFQQSPEQATEAVLMGAGELLLEAMNKGPAPKSAEELPREPGAPVLSDGWGNPVALVSQAAGSRTTFRLRSAGPDGSMNTPDDRTAIIVIERASSGSFNLLSLELNK